MSTITKTAMITVAGRPNVGKSTLTNALTGEKVAIVTNKPQTTRNRIFGVVNRGDTQVVLLDTPGFHKARTRLGDYMVSVVRQSVSDVDAVMLLVEPVPLVGTQEKLLLEHIEQSKVPALLVINKIDTVKKDTLLAVIAAYTREHTFEAVLPISAKTGEGVPELALELEKFATEGPQLFPDGMTTDQPEKQIVAEIVREKLLICLDREIPHGTAVEVTKFSERDGGADKETPIIDLDVTIYCEKASHKGMIIGKNGAMLKKIGQLAREDIEKFMGAKVFLQTWVKVKENWRDSEMLIRNFGYDGK
jgi:GTP-binding protein Era